MLETYGREVGFAYQLADDIVDLEKGEMIDSVVIPLLTRLERKSMKNGSLKAKTIKKKLEESSPEIQKLYLTEIRTHLSNAEAISTSELIPHNDFKTLLKQAPAHIINKMLEEINIKV